MYDEVYENVNEVVETETTNEVDTSTTDDYTPAPVTAPQEIIITESTESGRGPNKALIAGLVVGGLFVAKKAAKKIKPAIDKRKAKKAEARKQEIMDVLISTGVVQKPEEPKAEDSNDKVIEVAATEVKETKTEETKETSEKKEEKTNK